MKKWGETAQSFANGIEFKENRKNFLEALVMLSIRSAEVKIIFSLVLNGKTKRVKKLMHSSAYQKKKNN